MQISYQVVSLLYNNGHLPYLLISKDNKFRFQIQNFAIVRMYYRTSFISNVLQALDNVQHYVSS